MVFIVVLLSFEQSLPERLAVGLTLFDFAVQVPAGRERKTHAQALPADFVENVPKKFVHV